MSMNYLEVCRDVCRLIGR